MRIRTLLTTFTLTAFLSGIVLAGNVAFDASPFDAYEADEGYIDLVLEEDTLTFVLDETEGSLPAYMTSDLLPIDEDDVEETLLDNVGAMALYGGLAVEETPFSVTVTVEGDRTELRDAVLARLDALGITYGEILPGGPVFTFDLQHGENTWQLAISASGLDTVLHLHTAY